MSGKKNKAPKQDRVITRSRRVTFLLFSIPGIFLYSLFFIYPVLMGIYYSLTDWDGISRKINFIGLANYVKIFTKSPRFRSAILFNLRYTAMYVALILVLGILLAIILNHKVKGITFFRGAFFLPAVLCGVTVGLIYSQIFYRIVPLVGQALGIEALSSNILGNKDLAIYGILFVGVWQGLAMPTVLFLAGLQTIPQDLYESAMIDGANSWHRFKYITFPFLIPVITIVLILSVKGGLGIFDLIKALTDGGPARSTESVSFLVYADAFDNNKFSFAIAESIVVGIILAMISVIQIFVQNKKKVNA
ncbi:MAG: carbohydrate ABC transporter permease [Candidatus Faecivicinus sp.]